MRDDLAGNGVRVKVDDRDQHRPGYKFSEWELKGVPIRIEIGPKDVDAEQVVLAYRFDGRKEELRYRRRRAGHGGSCSRTTQRALYEDATAYREANTHEVDTTTPSRRESPPRAASGSAPGAATTSARTRSPRDLRDHPPAADRTGGPGRALPRVRQARHRTSHLGQGLLAGASL